MDIEWSRLEPSENFETFASSSFDEVLLTFFSLSSSLRWLAMCKMLSMALCSSSEKSEGEEFGQSWSGCPLQDQLIWLLFELNRLGPKIRPSIGASRMSVLTGNPAISPKQS